MGKLTIFLLNGSFSIAMLNYQRVTNSEPIRSQSMSHQPAKVFTARDHQTDHSTLLIGGFTPSEKCSSLIVTWDYEIPNTWKHKSYSKPPTSGLQLCFHRSHLPREKEFSSSEVTTWGHFLTFPNLLTPNMNRALLVSTNNYQLCLIIISYDY